MRTISDRTISTLSNCTRSKIFGGCTLHIFAHYWQIMILQHQQYVTIRPVNKQNNTVATWVVFECMK